jgi:hypothetical protein
MVNMYDGNKVEHQIQSVHVVIQETEGLFVYL